MPFPDGVTLVTVTGQIAGVPDGQPIAVKFEASDWLVGPAANAVMPSFTRYAVVNSDGEFSISLPATDDPAWTPTGWAYNVTTTYGDTSTTGTLTVPYDGGTFDLADRIDIGGAETAGVTYMPLSLRSAAGGVAGLDVDGDVIDAAGNKVGEASGGGISETIVNAKGDLIAATANDTVTRLAVGSNGQYLTAASGQATGLAWDTFTASDISDSTATGRAVVTATDAAAARTAIDAQQLDSDLTTIAGLTATSDNIIQSVAGAWASRTPTQVKSALAIGISDVTSLQAGLDAKAPLASPTFTGTVAGISKSMVGLGNVDNTSDAGKPISTATQTALAGKVDESTLTTKGDLYVATGSATVVRLPAGTDDHVLTADSGEAAGVKWAAPAGGGGSTLVVKRAVVSSGNITPQNTSSTWQPLTGGPTLAIPAAVGDYISIEIMALLMAKDSATFYDLAVLNGASLVRFGSSGTGTPANEGDGSLYHDTAFPRTGTVFDFVAESGDINGGNVTACFAVLSAGAGTFHAGFYPFRWRVLNHGAATVS